MESQHPYAHLETTLTVGAESHKMFNINQYIQEKKLPHQLPFCIRVLLESAIRNCDNFNIKRKSSQFFLSHIFSCRRRKHPQLEGDFRARHGSSIQTRSCHSPGLHRCPSCCRFGCHAHNHAATWRRPQKNQSPLPSRPRHRSLSSGRCRQRGRC